MKTLILILMAVALLGQVALSPGLALAACCDMPKCDCQGKNCCVDGKCNCAGKCCADGKCQCAKDCRCQQMQKVK